MRRVSLLAADSRWVWAELAESGALVISGQDLRPPPGFGDEYEWTITVEAVDVPVVVAALGGNVGDDVLALLAAHADQIIRTGESRWLRGIGVEPQLWSWSS